MSLLRPIVSGDVELELYATADEYFSTFVDPVSATNPNKKKKKKPKRKKGRNTFKFVDVKEEVASSSDDDDVVIANLKKKAWKEVASSSDDDDVVITELKKKKARKEDRKAQPGHGII
jgi:hypothetical protein